MKKQIIIAGIGMGNAQTITAEVMQSILDCKIIIGAKRMLAFAKEMKETHSIYVESYKPEEICDYMLSNNEKQYLVLMSGDSGFFSGCKKLQESIREKIPNAEVICKPGISSLSFMSSAFGISYQNMALCSVHGKTCNIAYKVRTNKYVFCLTDGDITSFAEHLCEYGLGEVICHIGIDLSYDKQKLVTCLAKEVKEQDLQGELVSVIVENPNYVSENHPLKDSDFIRGEVPMTKQDVRALIAGYIDVPKDGVIYDIGAGTGAVSCMLASKVPDGSVYALECNRDAIALIEANAKQFGMDQIHVIETMAPDGLTELPKADVVFIGGSKGRLDDILQTLSECKRGETLQVIMSAITLETQAEFLSLLSEGAIEDGEIIKIEVSRSKQLGSYHMFTPQNAIYICKGIL